MPEARFWLLKVIGRIFAAPFFYVGFADFWIADQLNSMATVFTDFHFAACFYITPNSTINGKMIKQLWQLSAQLIVAIICSINELS